MLNSDWTTKVTKDQFEVELQCKWDGPGLYYIKNDSLLAICSERDTDKLWNWETDANEVIDVYVYNDRNIATILNLFNGVPSRTKVRLDRI